MRKVFFSGKPWVLGAVLWLCACAAAPEPLDYYPDTEVKPGRGIITGEDGVYTIYRQPMPAQETDEAAAAGTAESDEAALGRPAGQ